MSRPIIGITLDSEPAGGWSKMPWYALRQNYCDAVARAGGLPIPLPHEPELTSEYPVTRGAIEADKPVLGICGGQQLMNVVLGGTLIQHIPDEVKNPLAHEQPNPRTEPGHAVRVARGTLLFDI